MCGIVGLYALRQKVPVEVVVKALDVMKERGTPHGAGLALYNPSDKPRIKAFTRQPVGNRYVKLYNDLYDVELSELIDIDGYIYLNSKWIDVYKVVGWPADIIKTYGISGLSSNIWLGHTRYPTNSPGRLPYYSHPFTAGDVAIVHNGDLSSYGSNINFIRYRAHVKFTGNDSEAIAYLLSFLVRELGVKEAVEELMYGRRYRWARLDGPYAVSFIIGGPKPVFGAFVDPQHFRPLYVGMTDSMLIVASEAAAIKAIEPRAAVWALRSGEYIIAEGDEVHGNFKKRYVYPELPQPPEDAIDASQYDAVSLAPVVRAELQKRGEVKVVNVLGHRYLGNGMSSGTLKVWGVVGNASANVMSGGVYFVYGDVQDDFGDAMNGGLAAIFGNAGDAVGQAKRGGEIYVYGDVGSRAAIQHRGGVMVVGGSAGKYLGEYMGGGTVVVLRATNNEEVGNMIGRGMVGGEIYIRGEVPMDYISPVDKRALERYAKSLLIDGLAGVEDYTKLLDGAEPLAVEQRELTEEEIAKLSPYITKFNNIFNLNIKISRDIFTIIRPKK
ncbi:Glutamine amidotransferases class-II/GXGXG motif protein [Pyrobaculum oguniense TE7]|uniref:Glutamine amidotransferases class-II/GXGXG motif protein n=1 Tax=Pyrobaculum oguniense (strain DSM 13380 / JCM 10595 / TE7) TaxID=698757 RepID=H6Q8P5_PYROT|nr:Glutamine amidotransferases class-II/GXGXG motif protein [Pyrobaculum oguniense TE7]